MSENPKRLIGAREVAEKLRIGRTKAYELIRELNLEMERKGCRTIPGRVLPRFPVCRSQSHDFRRDRERKGQEV